MKKANLFLTSCTIFLIIAILLVDNNTLNSIFIKEKNIKVDEIAVLNFDYKDEPAKQVAEVTHVADTNNNSNNNSTNAIASDAWKWPTDSNYTITTYYSSSHNAIDIYSNSGYGSNIYAANNGTVTLVMGGCVAGNLSCNGLGGNYVVINHNNGYYTVYMHLKNITVKKGDIVSKGQVIGTMGNTGNVIPVPTSASPYLGTHLHFAVYRGEPFKSGYTINPISLY